MCLEITKETARDQMFFTKRIGIFMAEFLAIFINYVNL